MPASPTRQSPADSGTWQRPVTWYGRIDTPSRTSQADRSRWQGSIRHGLEPVGVLNFEAARHVSGAGPDAMCRLGPHGVWIGYRAHPIEAQATAFGSADPRRSPHLAS
ncbi:MAG: hypothetical protein F4X17_25540 [Gemmatimonadetes bacterium]|nr:hypothetical protein [Gemmatimonadota bacterium]